MKTIALSLAGLGLSMFMGQAMANDAMSNATPTPHQQMKDCIERQKQTDVTQSKAAMTRICKDQLKQKKQTGASPEPPPTDTPRE